MAKLKEEQINGSLPFVLCPDDKPVYNGSQCLAIPAGQLYILKDGSFYTPVKVTNIKQLQKSPAFLENDKSTLTKLNNTIKNHTLPVDVCPAEKPYAVNASKCINCQDPTPYFDLEKQKCVACPEDLFYDRATHRCEREINITNVAGLQNFIETANYTRDNIKRQL